MPNLTFAVKLTAMMKTKQARHLCVGDLVVWHNTVGEVMNAEFSSVGIDVKLSFCEEQLGLPTVTFHTIQCSRDFPIITVCVTHDDVVT